MKEAKPEPVVLVPARRMREAEIPRPCVLVSAFLAELGVESYPTYACAQIGSERVETVAVRSRAGAFVYRYREDLWKYGKGKVREPAKPAWRFESAIVRTKNGVQSLPLAEAKTAVAEWVA